MEPPAIQTYRDFAETERSARPGLLFRMLSEGRREVVFWTLQTLFWAALGFIGFYLTRAFQSTMPDAGWLVFIRVLSGFVLTAGLRFIYQQPSLCDRSGLTKWVLVAGCCLAVGLVEVLVLKGFSVAGISIPGNAESVGVRLLFVRLFSVAVWSAFYFAFHVLEDEHAMELRAARAELAARENELRLLQAQMSPHFLFNALNGVLACKNDPEAVEDVTRSLSEYLRFLLQETQPLVPLARELDALEKFLTVQTSRFKENLVCRIQWDPAARAVLVPPMMIQPLLENALQHRSRTHDLPLQIWLTACVGEGFLRVTLSNTGERVPPPGNQQPDNGIHSLSQRLTLLLGPQARVEQQTENGWILVTIHIPLHG